MSDLNQMEIDRLMKERNDGWNEELRYDYPLTEDSVVWDVGAWHGDFTDQIVARFKCTVHTFEVLDRSSEVIANNFWNHKVEVHRYGLGDRDEMLNIRDTSECTSNLVSGMSEVKLKKASDELTYHIDLLKLNVEGYEYRIIENLYNCSKLSMIDYIQIQFHDYIQVDGIYLSVPGAHEQYKRTQDRLGQTHTLQWSQPFVWESWSIKPSD